MVELNKEIKVLILSILQYGIIKKVDAESLIKYFVDNKLVDNPLLPKITYEDFNK